MTIAFEAFVFHGHYGHANVKPGKVAHFSLSYAEYGPRVGVWRILRSLEKHKIRATFDVGGLAAERHPAIMRAMRDGGHEAAGHGWANDVHTSDDDPQGELKSIRDTGDTHPAHHLYDKLSEINESSPYHHGENLADATPDDIDPVELKGLVKRTLRITNNLQA